MSFILFKTYFSFTLWVFYFPGPAPTITLFHLQVLFVSLYYSLYLTPRLSLFHPEVIFISPGGYLYFTPRLSLFHPEVIFISPRGYLYLNLSLSLFHPEVIFISPWAYLYFTLKLSLFHPEVIFISHWCYFYSSLVLSIFPHLNIYFTRLHDGHYELEMNKTQRRKLISVIRRFNNRLSCFLETWNGPNIHKRRNARKRIFDIF